MCSVNAFSRIFRPLDYHRNLRVTKTFPTISTYDFEIIRLSEPAQKVCLVKQAGYDLNPTAGTRPRGKDEREDKALAEELLLDEKEVAEHRMLLI